MLYSRILICCCADYQRLSSDGLRTLAASAEAAGMAVIVIPDLCLKVVHDPAFLRSRVTPETVVAACHPRAVQALLDRLSLTAATLLDLRGESLDEHLRALEIDAVDGSTYALPAYDHPWKAWFPVIDGQRCTHCGKCLDYCIFGSYSRRNGRVEVAQPDACKTDCPACARICPQQAIIFPKHPEPPINGGKAETESASEPATAPPRFDENLYETLAARRRAARRGKLTKE